MPDLGTVARGNCIPLPAENLIVEATQWLRK